MQKESLDELTTKMFSDVIREYPDENLRDGEECLVVLCSYRDLAVRIYESRYCGNGLFDLYKSDQEGVDNGELEIIGFVRCREMICCYAELLEKGINMRLKEGAIC